MGKDYVLALDQGTTSSRAILYSREGAVVGVAQQEFQQHYPHPGWVEHDANEIWETQKGVMGEVLATVGVSAPEVAAIGITNQRETVVVWERCSGRPIHPAIVWQCRRTAKRCAVLRENGAGERVRSATGLLLDPYFSGTKIAWILDHVDGARARAARGELCAGTIDSWLIWNLTGGQVHATDVSNAARTMLMHTGDLAWDPSLLELLDVPPEVLPEIVPSSGVVGMASIDGVDVPIAGVAGDQQAALFGQGCLGAGSGKNTYGTGCFLLVQTEGARMTPPQGLLSTVAWKIGDEVSYALEGSVFAGGAVIQWLRDELGLIKSAAESEAVACSIPDTGGVHVVPAFAGLGAPHWCDKARGVVTGLSRGSGRAQMVRAGLESIALQSMDLVDQMGQGGEPILELRVDGGASRNNFLMQYQADLLGIPVVRPADVETTARGAALLAGLGVGMWSSCAALPVDARDPVCFAPQRDEAWRQAQRDGWERAVATALAWSGSSVA
jgi:glycerol kinase